MNYVIINADDIQSRIDELNTKIGNNNPTMSQYTELNVLEAILSNSISLIPEIEKAYFEGECYGVAAHGYITKNNYVSQLKFDI